jgi:hypothetical protein
MADNSVVVARYIFSYEAELARNMLEAQGIAAYVTGGAIGLAHAADAFQLAVHSNDAVRASAILAAYEAEVSLEEDWENKAAEGRGTWTCSVCGEPVAETMETCFACSTPRDAIRTDRPPTLRAPHRDIPPEAIQSEDQTASKRPLVVNTDPVLPEGDPEPGSPEKAVALVGADLLAQRAFLLSWLSFPIVLLLPVAWWNLLSALGHFDELTPRGRRRFFAAALLDVAVTIVYAPLLYLLARAFLIL